MAEPFVLAFVDKLMQLEALAGADVSYKLMAPARPDFRDAIALQRRAAEIAEFVGLSGLTIIATLAHQKENVGGHIDLSTRGSEVFIEIDPGALTFAESVDTTLCHEICHKWLQLQGLSSPIEPDNERLTDTTAVFLGLGKLMLNGCILRRVTHETTSRGTRQITHSHRTGYLDQQQLAFVYLLVCSMRRIPEAEFMEGLSQDAAATVYDSLRSHGGYVSEIHFEPEAIRNAWKGARQKLTAVQKQLVELGSHLHRLHESISALERGMSQSHQNVQSLCLRGEVLGNRATHDPAMRFLQGMRDQHELDQIRIAIEEQGRRAEELLEVSESLCMRLPGSNALTPELATHPYELGKCPLDGSDLRLPESPQELAKCPKCGYQLPFRAAEMTASSAHPPTRRCSSLFGKLFRDSRL